MTAPARVRSTTFARNFAQYQHEAMRQVLVVGELGDDVIADIVAAEYGADAK